MTWEQRLEAVRTNAVNFDDSRLADLVSEAEDLADRLGDILAFAEDRIKDLEDEDDWYENELSEEDDSVENDD